MSDAATFGYGRMTPEDFATDSNAIAFVVRQILSQAATAKVVTVVSVTPGSGSPPAPGTVDVMPLVKQIDGNGNAVGHGTVYGLRYVRLQAGPWAIVADPAVGDVGIIVCADRDSSSVVDKTPVTPRSRRRFNISDGIYIGGILGQAPKAYFQLNSDGTLKLSDQNGNVLQTSSSGFMITGNLKVSGSITAGVGGGPQVGLQTHTHPANGSPPTPGT